MKSLIVLSMILASQFSYAEKEYVTGDRAKKIKDATLTALEQTDQKLKCKDSNGKAVEIEAWQQWQFSTYKLSTATEYVYVDENSKSPKVEVVLVGPHQEYYYDVETIATAYLDKSGKSVKKIVVQHSNLRKVLENSGTIHEPECEEVKEREIQHTIICK